jgi:hypothetical protein
LLSALNKYWRKITDFEYWYEMDNPMTDNAIAMAQFPKEVDDWIWEKEYTAFSVIPD